MIRRKHGHTLHFLVIFSRSKDIPMGYGINISRIKQTLSHVVSALILFITVKGRYEVCYVFVIWAWDMKNMLTVIVFFET